MENIEGNIIVSIGHTAAGKTSLLKYLAKKLAIEYIEESQVKRDLLNRAYNSADSLNEELRDEAYTIAISLAMKKLIEAHNIIIDASFHRNYRRLWVYQALEKLDRFPIVIWIFFSCSNIDKVKERIAKRTISTVKGAENQADQFFIYEHIMSSFDPVSISAFPGKYNNVIFNVDTNNDSLTFNSSNFCNQESQPVFCSKVFSQIAEYLHNKAYTQKEWEN